MAKYTVGDEVIIKCYERLKQEGDIFSEKNCGIRVKIEEILPNGGYYCAYDSNFFILKESVILGKSGGITLQPGLAIACRDRTQIGSIVPLLSRFKNKKEVISSVWGVDSVRIFFTYNNLLKFASGYVDNSYYNSLYNDCNYNYIEFSDLALKNEIVIRKLNQCKILYNELAHCYCSEECWRCNIEV